MGRNTQLWSPHVLIPWLGTAQGPCGLNLSSAMGLEGVTAGAVSQVRQLFTAGSHLD